MRTFAIALLLATASAATINQRFADGMTDEEIINGQDAQKAAQTIG